MPMLTSILDSNKKVLSIHPTDPSFDEDIIMHVNGVFSTLQQLGVGPDEGFMIQDKDDLWEEYPVSANILNQVKVYMFLSTKILFDPPASSPALDALKEQRDEKGWRLQVQAEDEKVVLSGG